jgi:hypothetical protein
LSAYAYAHRFVPIPTHQCLGVFNVYNTHALNLFGGEEAELDFLDGAQRRLGIWEKHVRHDGGVVVCFLDERKTSKMTEHAGE